MKRGKNTLSGLHSPLPLLDGPTTFSEFELDHIRVTYIHERYLRYSEASAILDTRRPLLTRSRCAHT